MNTSLHQRVLWSLLLVFVSAGCGSNAKSANGEAPTVKPIDQVQRDILTVKQQLIAAIDAAEPRAGDLPEKVTATDSAIANLRTTLAQLDQRSNEYLVMWSKQASVTVHSGGVYRSHTQVPQRTRAKYDELLTALRAARDKVNPALTDLRQIVKSGASENTSNLAARARELAKQGIERLNDASKYLEELKVLVRQT